jgi:hypothetical protein
MITARNKFTDDLNLGELNRLDSYTLGKLLFE